ncbi:MAG: hypothetical protein CME06_16150 [Gemmatimonadetes bacterium]|nr:hypothetical protein [Gemmatimonadota bacterium]
MLNFDICFRSTFLRRDVSVCWNETAYAPPREIEDRVARLWKSALAKASHHGQSLFAGPLCRLDDHQIAGDRLFLSLSMTDYRDLQGTSGSAWPGGLPRAARADGIGVNSAIVTADRQLVLVRRSESVYESPGTIDTGGGHIDPMSHRSGGRPDPFAAIESEIRDEFGLVQSELEETRLLGLARHRPGGKPELLFLAEISLPFSVLPGRLGSAIEGSETAELMAVPLVDAEAALIAHEHELSPSGQASIYFALREWERTGTLDRAR